MKIIIPILVVFICILSYSFLVNQYPSHTHAWAQADHYALSLCFLENGFDFFHPCTFNYNLQFPSTLPLVSEAGITAVDFPLNEYVIAILMKLFGTTSPAVFRIYTLVYSLIGLYFLFKLANLFLKSTYFSFIVVTFVLFSPVYFYYQIGFLPSIPSLASLFIGLYYYFQHKNTSDLKHLMLGTLFLTLAGLYRLPFTIFLIAAILVELKNSISIKKIYGHPIKFYLIGLAAIGGYFLYNQYLRQTYGSIFLGTIRPSLTLNEIQTTIVQAISTWGLHYFTISHYVLFLFLFVCFFITYKNKFKNLVSNTLFQFILFSFLGVSLYSFLMLHQFRDHDYYFLDTFFPIFPLLIIGLINHIHFPEKIVFTFYKLSLSLLIISAAILCYSNFKLRTSTGAWDDTNTEQINFTGADTFLDSLRIPRSAKILVLGAHNPNMPFVQMKRKGYAQLSTSKKSIVNALKFDFDYIVLQKEWMYNEVLINFPSIINQLKKIAENEHLIFYTLNKNKHSIEMQEFLGFSDSTTKKIVLLNFDSLSIPTNIKITGERIDSISHSFPYSECVSKENGVSIQLDNKILGTENSTYCLYEGYFLSSKDETATMLIVTLLDSTNKLYYFKTYPLAPFVKQKNRWNKVTFGLTLPPLKNNAKAFIYIYNPALEKLFYDDIKMLVR